VRVPRAVLRWAGRLPARVGRHLRLAWPVFVVFLVQRLLTVVWLPPGDDGLRPLSTRWDAGWYLRLAQGGYQYPNLMADGDVGASNLAYFPLFPWLVRQLGATGLLSVGQALVVVSWVGGLLAVWAIFAVGHALYGRGAGIALAALWGIAPASLTLTMGYPEGLFTAAAAAALFFLIRRRPVWAGLAAVVAGLLRPSAVAVIAMVGVYFLVEIGRWLALRRSHRAKAATSSGAEPQTEPDPDRPRPGRAFLGAVLSTLGLGAFLVYVGMRTGEVFGYFTVQAQWGQQPAAGFADYWRAVERGLLESPSATLIPVTLAACLGYLLLFGLIVFDRRLVWASVYAAVLLVLSLTHVTFQHVYARQLLPAFVLLIPLVRIPVPRAGAVAALTVGSIVVGWASAAFLLNPGSGL
jgi:hypothetical protein